MGNKLSSFYVFVKNASFFSLMLSIIYDAYSVNENSKKLDKSNIQMELKNINDQGNMGLRSSLRDVVKRRIDISGAKLNNRFLTGINISYARGQEVDWTGSQMQRSIISHTNLPQSNFSNADLTGATLHCFNNSDEYCNGTTKKITVESEFYSVDPFEDEKPSNVTEEDGYFGVLFIRANLKDSIMTHGDFTHDNFSNADLSRANLKNSNFSYAIFDNAVLDDADISGSNFQNARGLTQEIVNTTCFIPHMKPSLPTGINLPHNNCLNRIKILKKDM